MCLSFALSTMQCCPILTVTFVITDVLFVHTLVLKNNVSVLFHLIFQTSKLTLKPFSKAFDKKENLSMFGYMDICTVSYEMVILV